MSQWVWDRTRKAWASVSPELCSGDMDSRVTLQGKSPLSQNNTSKVKNISTISHKYITQRATGPVKEVLLHYFGLRSVHSDGLVLTTVTGDNLIMPALDTGQQKTVKASLLLFFFLICSGFCHTLKWNSHGFTCVPHPYSPSHLPLHRVPLGFPIAPGPITCLMHPTWAGDQFHPR